MRIPMYSTSSSGLYNVRPNKFSDQHTSIVNTIENRIHNQEDMLKISQEGQMRLKVRNLHEVEKLEKQEVEMQKKLTSKLNLYTSLQDTLKDAQDWTKKCMSEALSTEDKKDIQSKLDDILDAAEDIILKAMRDKADPSVKENETQIEFLQDEKSADEDKKDPLKQLLDDLDDVNVLEDPLKAHKVISKALDIVSSEVSKLQQKLLKLEKKMDKLLGEEPDEKTTTPMNDENSKEIMLKELEINRKDLETSKSQSQQE